jgi:hypothetical protein
MAAGPAKSYVRAMSEPAATPRPLLERLGPRARRRAQPRASIALAGAGCALVVVGAFVLSVDGATNDSGSFTRWPGLLLTSLVALSGAVVQHLYPRTPLATAGTVAVILAVPVALGFATLDPNDLPPFSAEGILVVSTLVYGLAYTMGPGRGRPAYLGAAAIGLWASALQVVEHAFDAPFRVFGLFAFPLVPYPFLFESGYEDGYEYGSGDEVLGIGGLGDFDPTTAGFLSLAIGIGFVVLSRRLDRRGFSGAATPLLVAAFPALYIGVVLLANELEAAGTGLLIIAVGAGLALHGASVGRRATTWFGAVLVPLGLVPIVLDLSDTAGTVGVLFLLLGVGLVALAQAWSLQRPEPDEMAVAAGGPPRRTTPLRAQP